jgi:hypothetical protein
MLDAAIGKEERQQRFQAAMVANLMNSTGNYKKLITAEMLLGTERAKSGKTVAEMNAIERNKFFDRAWAKLEKKRGQQKKTKT